jgi:hypothetical protein
MSPKGGTDTGATRPGRRAVIAFGFALGLVLTACSGKGGDTTAPDPDPAPHEPGPAPHDPDPVPGPNAGVQGHYVLAQINNSQPGQLVTIANPDGTVIGLYRFDAATTLDMDALQTFDLRLRYTDDKAQYELPDEGEFKQAGPVSEGALPLTFTSATYDDAFTGVALQGIVAIKYDFDGDGELETSFGFQRTD